MLPSSVPSVVLTTVSTQSKLQCFQPCSICIWHLQKASDCQREKSTADSKLSLLHGLWERCAGTAWRKWRRAQQAAKPSLASHCNVLGGKPPTTKAAWTKKTRLSGNISKDEGSLQEKKHAFCNLIPSHTTNEVFQCPVIFPDVELFLFPSSWCYSDFVKCDVADYWACFFPLENALIQLFGAYLPKI